MEAGTTPAEQTAPDTGQQTTDAPSQGQSVDFQPVMDRLDELAGQISGYQPGQQGGYDFSPQPQEPVGYPSFDYQQFGQFQQQPGFDPAQQYGQQPYQGQQPDPYQQGFDPNQPYGQQFDQYAQDPGIQQYLQAQIQPLQQAIQGLSQQFVQDQTQRHEASIQEQVGQLEDKYPELKDQGVANKTMERAVVRAESIAAQVPPHLRQTFAQHGVDLAELIASQPGFVELEHLARRGQQQTDPAQGEQGGSQDHELEAGGGAAPSGDGSLGQWIAPDSGDRRKSIDELF